jgi:hypothetical protein
VPPVRCASGENFPQSAHRAETQQKPFFDRFRSVFDRFPDRPDSRIAWKIRHRAVFRRTGAVKKR